MGIWRKVKPPLEMAEHVHFIEAILESVFGWRSWILPIVGTFGTFLWAAIDGRSPLDVWVLAVLVGAGLAITVLAASTFWKMRFEHDRPSPARETSLLSPSTIASPPAAELAGLVNGLVEAGLAWTFKLPLGADDRRLKSYEELEQSTHPIWTDPEINQLRREFLHWWAIVGSRDEHGNTAAETKEARAELHNYGRQLIDRLNRKARNFSIRLNTSPSRIDDYLPVSAITIIAIDDLNECLIQIEEFSGRWPDGMPNPLVLRTDGQIRGGRSGRFKLSKGQPKTVPIIFHNKIRSNEWYFFDENGKSYFVPAGPAKFLLRVYGGIAPATILLFVDTDAGWNPIPSLRVVADGYSLNFN